MASQRRIAGNARCHSRPDVFLDELFEVELKLLVEFLIHLPTVQQSSQP